MNPQQEFVMYLEEHPEYYIITQSKLYIDFLEFLENQARDIDQIHEHFPKIEVNDVELILKSLIALKLVSKTTVVGKVMYYSNENAKEFLEKYRKTKDSFSVE